VPAAWAALRGLAGAPPSARGAGVVTAVVVVQLLSSLRFFHKYVDMMPWVFYGGYVTVGVLACLVVVRNGRLLDLVSRPAILGAGVAGLTAMVAVAYPAADALRDVGRGSDQDDCVRELVSNVFALRAPFGKGYFGDPCSTGPGEVFVYFPLELTSAFFVVVPGLVVLLGCWALTLLVSLRTAVLLSLTQLVSWLFLELSAVGSDLMVIAWLFATAVTASLVGLRRHRGALMAVGAVSYTLVASSRLPLVLVVAASLAVLTVRCGPRALRIAAPALVATAVLYLGTYAVAPARFRPGHLVGKSGRVVRDLVGVPGAWVLAFSVVLLLCVVGLLLRGRLVSVARRQYHLVQLVVITAPMAFVAAWDLRRAGFDPAAWEGLHYVYVGMPCLLLAAADLLRRRGAV
jgi:hypothetical protein